MNNNENFVASKKRKLGDDAPANKKPRIVRERKNSNEFLWDTNKQQNSLYYIPKPKACTSPIEKSLRSNNGHIFPATQKYSANERLKCLRKNLQRPKPQNFQHSNNNKEKSVSPYKPATTDHHQYVPTIIAKPSSLDQRIKSIRESASHSQINNTHSYFTSTPNTNTISPSKLNVSGSSNHSAQNVVENDNSMDWSYIDEKKVLTKIHEIRNEDVITRVTPSTFFQECVAKELMDIPINNTILKDIYVVVDTNIFISQLDVIIKLLEIKVNDVTPLIILIPWIVIQELDFFKDRMNSKLKKNSQKAMHFINEKLSSKHPQVKGQSVRDAAQQNFSSRNADDSILHCCLQVVEKHNRAMLLSNDINLRNKAIIHGIDAYSHTGIINALDPYNGIDNNFENIKAKEIELYFKNLFSYIILMQLKESYGTALSHMDSELKNPPWTLLKCLKLFQRFWQPIFSMFLQKQFLPKVEHYIAYLNKCGSLDTIKTTDLKGYIDYGLAICVYLKNGFHMYEDSIAECVNGVENICKNLSSIEFI